MAAIIIPGQSGTYRHLPGRVPGLLTESGQTARLAAEQVARERGVAEARAAELTASEARLRAILEAAHDGVLSIDQHARITYANTTAERIFGYRADELIGQEMAEVIVPPSLREAHAPGFPVT